jgi:hypothetical protein
MPTVDHFSLSRHWQKIPLEIWTDRVWTFLTRSSCSLPCSARGSLLPLCVRFPTRGIPLTKDCSARWNARRQSLCAASYRSQCAWTAEPCVHERLEWQRLELAARMPSMHSFDASHCGLRHAVGDLVPLPLHLVTLDLSWNVRAECF